MAPVFPAAFAAALMASAWMSGCMGGSDGIENPKLELEFRGPDGTASGTGEVRIYARHLNPVEDGKPLLAKSFSGKAVFELTREEMDSAIRAGLSGKAIPDTVVEFNVVAVSGGREAFASGFRYRRAGPAAGFAQGDWNRADLDYGEVMKTVSLLDAVVGFKGGIGLAGQSFGIDYVYIPGSPYHAQVGKDRDFTIARMSRGSFDLVGADRDSAAYFLSGDTLRTEDSAYVAKTWEVFTIIDVP